VTRPEALDEFALLETSETDRLGRETPRAAAREAQEKKAQTGSPAPPAGAGTEIAEATAIQEKLLPREDSADAGYGIAKRRAVGPSWVGVDYSTFFRSTRKPWASASGCGLRKGNAGGVHDVQPASGGCAGCLRSRWRPKYPLQPAESIGVQQHGKRTPLHYFFYRPSGALTRRTCCTSTPGHNEPSVVRCRRFARVRCREEAPWLGVVCQT